MQNIPNRSTDQHTIRPLLSVDKEIKRFNKLNKLNVDLVSYERQFLKSISDLVLDTKQEFSIF